VLQEGLLFTPAGALGGEATAHVVGARRELVARHLDTLAIMGELQQMPDGRYGALLVTA
jgi:hypothetical protein